jgi:uncharacterized membrane protein
MIVLLPWLGLVLLGIAAMQWGAARAATTQGNRVNAVSDSFRSAGTPAGFGYAV